eukprot:5754857-Lingulodinium_polyedra.AAC.1
MGRRGVLRVLDHPRLGAMVAPGLEEHVKELMLGPEGAGTRGEDLLAAVLETSIRGRDPGLDLGGQSA